MSNLSLEERIKSLTLKQEKAILLLELHCLIRKSVLSFSEYEKAKEIWGI